MIQAKKEKNSPIPDISVRYVVNRENFKEMPKLIELINSIREDDTIGKGSIIEFANLLYFKEIKDYFMGEIPKDILEETIQKSKELDMNISFAHLGESNLPPMDCCTAWLEPYILTGGYVMPCCAVLMSNQRNFLRKNALGNLYETPFKDIWYSMKYKKFREMVVNPKAQVPILCKGCRAFDTQKREQQYGIDPMKY